MAEGQSQKKTAVERIFPRPVRSAFRTMNFYFAEQGIVINRIAKTLPEEERDAVREYGKRFCTARSKMNLPRGFRNVMSSLVIGQGMWYFGCPLLSQIPGIRDTYAGWFAWGGADKLFLAADQLLYTTGGYSSEFAGRLADAAPRTIAFGAAMLAWEILGDFSRCWIEYWSQKRFGVVADGAARLYGQSRPFLVRYSAFEAYQKIISYALRPWTIGTPAQIYSSVHAVLGNLWRIGPQLLLVTTVGRAIDRFFKKIAEWTGLSGVGKRIKENAERAAKEAMEGIENIIGPKKSLMLRYMLAADSRAMWNWRPFKPALSLENAKKAADMTYRFEDSKKAFQAARAAASDAAREAKDGFRKDIQGCLQEVTDIFGRKMVARLPEYKGVREALASEEWESAGVQEIGNAYDGLSGLLLALQTERQLN